MVHFSLKQSGVLKNVRVVLSHTTHPGNIGAAARAMNTMGLSRLYLVQPKHFPDPQASAMAAGSDEILANAVVCATLDEALQGVALTAGMSARVRDISQEVLAPREAAPVLAQQATQQEVALLFGTEMSGLTNEELARCQFMVRIPVNPAYSSLNLAAAVQLVCYELRLACVQADDRAPELLPAPAEQVERFFQHLESTLHEIEFLNAHHSDKHVTKLMHKLRRLYARARLEEEEIRILRGILNATSSHRTRLNSGQ